MTLLLSSGVPARVLIAGFEGWSDAGEATSGALEHLTGKLRTEVVHEISGEGYADLQVSRPRVQRDATGDRYVLWPDTRLWGPVARPQLFVDGQDEDTSADRVTRLDGAVVSDLFVLTGVEPSRDWQNFADEIVELVDVWAIDVVVLVGSLFSDAPHSRPIATSLSSESADLRDSLEIERSTYEGPAGIMTVLDIALQAAGIPTLSLWAQVPHYVHSSPSPKATLAILDKLEEILDIVIPRGTLLEEATEWESHIDHIASADEDMRMYISRLEEARDATMAAEAAGDAIALEFEKFLEHGGTSEPAAPHVSDLSDSEPSAPDEIEPSETEPENNNNDETP